MAPFRFLRLSLGEGWTNLRSNLSLSIYSILSVFYIYSLIVYDDLLTDFLGADLNLIFIVSIFFSTVASLLVGAYFWKQLQKSQLVWNIIGVIFGILLLLKLQGFVGLLVYIILGAISAGLCVPGIINMILMFTSYEDRGSVSGIFVFITYLLIAVSAFFITANQDLVILLITTKIIAILIILIRPLPKIKVQEITMIKYNTTVKFSFFLVWFIFLLVNQLAGNIITPNLPEDFPATQITMIIGFVSMLTGGVLMDKYGRKKLMIFAYAFLGLEYAFISLGGANYIFLTLLDGISFGILTIIFLLVIWGDIINFERRPLYIAISFSIALSTFFIYDVLRLFSVTLDFDKIFPLTSIFLFIAVVITLFLPETLPDKVMQAKDLREYINQAKKIKEKYS